MDVAQGVATGARAEDAGRAQMTLPIREASSG
jgi:hypothetical protein